jgi:hypothetical protein
MARVIARRDSAAGYVYIRSGDAFPVPEECRRLIKGNGGEFSGETKEWRLSLHRAADVVTVMRTYGHQVIATDAAQVREGPRLLECRNCGQPYGANAQGLLPTHCSRCNAHLELVPPHVCDARCDAAARSRVGA